MAISNKENGQYLKVIRERTMFTPVSVQVCYYGFPSRASRDAYFSRQTEISAFLRSLEATISKQDAELYSVVTSYAKGAGLESLRSNDELPADLREQAEKLQQLRDASGLVRRYGMLNVAMPHPANLSELVKLGFNKSWLKPLDSWGIYTVHTGTYTNQNFTYECLYKELKKVYPTYIDC